MPVRNMDRSDHYAVIFMTTLVKIGASNFSEQRRSRKNANFQFPWKWILIDKILRQFQMYQLSLVSAIERIHKFHADF